jgi:hypothetical protein
VIPVKHGGKGSPPGVADRKPQVISRPAARPWGEIARPVRTVVWGLNPRPGGSSPHPSRCRVLRPIARCATCRQRRRSAPAPATIAPVGNRKATEPVSAGDPRCDRRSREGFSSGGWRIPRGDHGRASCRTAGGFLAEGFSTGGWRILRGRVSRRAAGGFFAGGCLDGRPADSSREGVSTGGSRIPRGDHGRASRRPVTARRSRLADRVGRWVAGRRRAGHRHAVVDHSSGCSGTGMSSGRRCRLCSASALASTCLSPSRMPPLDCEPASNVMVASSAAENFSLR